MKKLREFKMRGNPLELFPGKLVNQQLSFHYQTDGIGYEKGQKFGLTDMVICLVRCIKEQKEKSELQNAPKHEEKTQAVLVFIGSKQKGQKNKICQQVISKIRNNYIMTKGVYTQKVVDQEVYSKAKY